MAETNLATDAQLAEFDARNTDFGLLRRYAMRRLRQLPSRLFMVAFGALLTGVMISPALGIVTLSLAVLGDCIDCLMLTQILRRGQDEGGDKVFRRLTSVSAGLQALSICACFGLTYSARPEPDVAFFVLGFLCGSAISDGMLIAYHRQATLVRLAAYCSTLLMFFGLRVYLDGALAQEHVFGLAGTVVLGYVVWSYVASLGRARMRSLAISRDLLLRQRELERVGADLNSSLEENRRLALVARHANDGVFISQVDGPILWVNDAFTQITGYSLAEAKGRRVSDLLNGPDTNPQTVARIQRAISEKRACRTEIQSYTKDGSSVWIDTNIVPLIEEDGSAQVVIAIERNITATRRQMQELAVATQEANDRAKVRSDFLATMSHEIRTPLNGMMGMAEMLTRSDLSLRTKKMPKPSMTLPVRF